MPRTPVENLIPKADKLIIRAFPKVAQRLDSEVSNLDRAEMDAFLKMLPGAIERFQAVTAPTNDLHEVVQVAISQLVTSFGPQNSSSRNGWSVEPAPDVDTSNMSNQTEETVESVSEPELPNGSDTSQQAIAISLPHNDLDAAAGNGGESDSAQADPHNPRVSKRGRSQGRRPRVLSRQASGDTANDRG